MMSAHLIIQHAPTPWFCRENKMYWCSKVLTWCEPDRVLKVIGTGSYKVHALTMWNGMRNSHIVLAHTGVLGEGTKEST
jgi:hypothetical protein